jgi:hypothetical protein
MSWRDLMIAQMANVPHGTPPRSKNFHPDSALVVVIDGKRYAVRSVDFEAEPDTVLLRATEAPVKR